MPPNFTQYQSMEQNKTSYETTKYLTTNRGVDNQSVRNRSTDVKSQKADVIVDKHDPCNDIT